MANSPNDLTHLTFPRDAFDSPAAVLFGMVNDDPRTGGKYVPIQVSPEGVLVSGPRTPNFTLMHDQVTAAETTIPLSPKGYSARGCSLLVIHIDMQPGSSVQIMPLTWSPIFQKYLQGDPSDVLTVPFQLQLDIQSPEDVYLLPIAVTGNVSIAVAGI